MTILGDEFDAPDVFAMTTAGAMNGSGYAQAEGRLEKLPQELPESRRLAVRQHDCTAAERPDHAWYIADPMGDRKYGWLGIHFCRDLI